MHYFSTNRASPTADFREAALRGQPDDRGLYFPAQLPRISARLFSGEYSNAEVAFEVIRPFVGEAIDADALFEICCQTVDFEFPLVKISGRISALELFHGPTLAFKDVGARFMSRCLRHFASGRKTLVLVATSGDTGGAVAAGFHNVEGVEVVILYPKGKVSRVQELQLTTLGGNVTAVEVDGVFDDCQSMAKHALADADIRSELFITSANSINIARWLPQQFYYLFALKQWEAEPPVFCVPSGNFGNICAGLLAHASGMPAAGFIAACNANSVVPDYLRSGDYSPRPSIATLSNAMDVGDPSNFVRILEIFGREYPRLKAALSAVSVSDAQTIETIKQVYGEFGYILDPHGAVAYRALEDAGASGIILETAHPVKFDSVADILGVSPPVPPGVAELFGRDKKVVPMPVGHDRLKELILSKV